MQTTNQKLPPLVLRRVKGQWVSSIRSDALSNSCQTSPLTSTMPVGNKAKPSPERLKLTFKHIDSNKESLDEEDLVLQQFCSGNIIQLKSGNV